MNIIKIVLSLALITAVVSPVMAEQQQNAYIYAFWRTSTIKTYTKLTQTLQVTQKAPASFWADTWSFTGGNAGGYVGLQTDGSRIDGSVGDTAIFSIWNATAATGSCVTFGGEGVGYSCRLPYPINTARKYRFRMEKGTVAADGVWWHAWIRDESTYKETKIGSIKAPAQSTAFSLPSNFSEYFGQAVPTPDDVPISIAQWSGPAVTPVGAYYASIGVYDSYARGSGTGGSVVSVTVGFFTKVARITLGGPR